MDKHALSSSLSELETSDSRPKAIQFREIHPQIEKALAAGASYQQVLEKINNHSKLALTPYTFRNYLERARKKLKVAGLRTEASIQASSSPNTKVPQPVSPTSAVSKIEQSTPIPNPPDKPFDRSDPRALDHAINTRRNFDELEAIGRASRKAQKK